MNGEAADRGELVDEREGGFGFYRYVVMFDPALSYGARILYCALERRCITPRSAYPGQDLLAIDLDCSVRMVRNYLNELSRRGLIRITRNRKDPQRTTNTYTMRPLRSAYTEEEITWYSVLPTREHYGKRPSPSAAQEGDHRKQGSGGHRKQSSGGHRKQVAAESYEGESEEVEVEEGREESCAEPQLDFASGTAATQGESPGEGLSGCDPTGEGTGPSSASGESPRETRKQALRSRRARKAQATTGDPERTRAAGTEDQGLTQKLTQPGRVSSGGSKEHSPRADPAHSRNGTGKAPAAALIRLEQPPPTRGGLFPAEGLAGPKRPLPPKAAWQDWKPVEPPWPPEDPLDVLRALNFDLGTRWPELHPALVWHLTKKQRGQIDTVLGRFSHDQLRKMIRVLVYDWEAIRENEWFPYHTTPHPTFEALVDYASKLCASITTGVASGPSQRGRYDTYARLFLKKDLADPAQEMQIPF